MKKSWIQVAVTAALAVCVFAAPASAQDRPREGLLKICKVAGAGVTVGTQFHFSISGGGSYQVPAGPGPSGYCMPIGLFPIGTNVTVIETNISGFGVSSITATPQPPNAINLATGTATVTIVPGATDLTYTDARGGWLEICKASAIPGNFTFTLNQSGIGPITIPAGTCSPAIQTRSGAVNITETTSPNGVALSKCYIWQGTSWVPCPVNGRTATVTVNSGSVASQTIVLLVNEKPRQIGPAGLQIPSEEVLKMLKSMGIPESPVK